MTPILGIMASQISGHLYTPTGSMYHIASTTLSTATNTITFSSIPADYTHLQLRVLSKSSVTGTGGYQDISMNVNSDTGANYSWHELLANGSTVSAYGIANPSLIRIADNPGAYVANAFGAAIIDFVDYANVNKYKTFRCLWGFDTNGNVQRISLRSGNWRSTSAITSITLTNPSYNFTTYSSFALYGVK